MMRLTISKLPHRAMVCGKLTEMPRFPPSPSDGTPAGTSEDGASQFAINHNAPLHNSASRNSCVVF